MSHSYGFSAMDDQDGFELVDNDEASSSTALPAASSANTQRRASHSSQPTSRTPRGTPSRNRQSYLSSLSGAFSRRTPDGSSNPPASPPPPPPSRRASHSSESSLDLDSVSGLFSAALSFGVSCDRRAAAATTATELPLAGAYNQRATWGDIFSRPSRRRQPARGQPARRRSPSGSSSSDEEPSRTPFSIPTVLGAIFGSRRKH